jgi:glycosyl hydrolase family 79
VTGASGAIRAWATRAPDGRISLVLINDDTGGSHVVAVRVPRARRTATLERLEAPDASATHGATLDGQSFGARTRTGLLAGASTTGVVRPVRGTYLVRLPAVSAALLTLPGTDPGASR